MMLAMGADFEVLIQFLVENHGTALRAFGPQALWYFPFLRFPSKFVLFGEGCLACRWGRRRNRWLRCLQPKCLFCKRSGAHALSPLFKFREPLSRRKLRPLP